MGERLYDFNDREIGVIDLALSSVLEATKHAIEEGMTPPDGLLETLVSAYNKLQEVIDLRCQDFNEFQELIQTLTDVESTAQQIVKDPEVSTPDYN
jgi:hypothetical protein